MIGARSVSGTVRARECAKKKYLDAEIGVDRAENELLQGGEDWKVRLRTNGAPLPGQTSCTRCGKGNETNAERTACTVCTGNSISYGFVTACTPCETGIADATHTSCQPCPPGSELQKRPKL